MNTRLAPSRRLRTVVFLAAAVLAAPAMAAGNCTLKADINPQSLTIPDFIQTPGGWTPDAVKLNGSASKPEVKDGGLYQWTVKSGPAGYSLANATTPQPTFTPPDVGNSGAQYVLTLTVTGCGSSASLDYPVSVTNAHDIVSNAAPHAVAGATPNPVDEGTAVTLQGSHSWDPDGNPLTYAWTQLTGPAATLDDASAPNPHFVAPNVTATTTLRFRLTVSDGTLTDSATVDVNVVWLNEAPVARVSCPLDVDEGQPVNLQGSASSDADDGIASFRWAQGLGGPLVPQLPADAADVSFPAPALGFQQTGLVPFTLTVTDHSGVESTAGCSIFIHDVTPPTISVADMLVDAESASGAHVAFAPAPSAFDAVDGDVSATLDCVPPSGSLFALGDTAVACTAHDSATNVAGAGFNVKVADLSAPLIAPHGDVATEATGPQGADVTYDLPATSDKVDGAGIASCAPPPGPFPLGSTVVDCDATDHAGNAAATSHFTVSVVDTQPPAIAIPEPIVAEATGPSGAAVAFAVTATDVVDGSVPVQCDHASGDIFPLGTTTIQCSTHDAASQHGMPQDNAATASFTVTVQDTTPPSLTMPAPVTLEATGPLTTLSYGTASATDLVDTDVAVACTPASGSAFTVGVTTVTCTATDDAGNASSGTVAMTVTDTTPPALSLPAGITAEATGPGGAAVAWSASANDLVDGARAVACAPASGSTFALGSTTVDCSASDARGNSAHGTFTVKVQDTTAPVIAPHADVTATATGNSQAVVTYANPTASDIVDGALETTCTPASGSTFNVGATTVTCSVTDGHDNTATSTFKVIVSYTFAGFFRPVDNLPTLNVVKAGQAIPVKFSLGGNQGLSILASGYPKAVVMSCTGTLQDAVEETVTAGGSSLQYDATSGQYIYVWKSDKAWAGSCRQLQLKFADGTTQAANFSFTR